MKKCPFYYLTILANIAMIFFALFLFVNAHGVESRLALLLLIPPLLSIKSLQKGGDREERRLKSRLRKAHLRKELKDLKEFDKE